MSAHAIAAPPTHHACTIIAHAPTTATIVAVSEVGEEHEPSLRLLVLLAVRTTSSTALRKPCHHFCAVLVCAAAHVVSSLCVISSPSWKSRFITRSSKSASCSCGGLGSLWKR